MFCVGGRSTVVTIMAQQANPKRRTYHWPGHARALVTDYLRPQQEPSNTHQERPTVRALITDIVTLTGHPRDVCFRFARQLGVREKRVYKEWTRAEQQRLLDLITLNPPHEVAKVLNRSTGSVYRMLNRLGASSQMGREWFTAYTLAQVLHISAKEVQKWIDNGWLQSRVVETGGLKKKIIDPDAFSDFCHKHQSAIVGRRLSVDRLEFVRTFVFPPRHTELLQVRERGYKRKDKMAEAAGGDGSPLDPQDIGKGEPELLQCLD
jgi:hypothetical protein